MTKKKIVQSMGFSFAETLSLNNLIDYLCERIHGEWIRDILIEKIIWYKEKRNE